MFKTKGIYRRKKNKILYLITQGILGGAQTHISHLATHLGSEFDVHVAVGVKGPLWNKLQSSGIPVYHVPSLVRSISPFKDIKCINEIVGLLKSIKPDLISTHSSKAGILGRLAAHRCGIPAIFTAHGWAFTEGVPEMQRRLYIHVERTAARWSGKIICVSEYDRQLALKHGVGSPEQLITIHNGMPLLPGDYLAKQGEKDPVRLIMVSRFSEQKDHQLLLYALSELRVNHDFVVDLVGDGPLLPQYKELTRKLALDDNVNILGARTDVPELLAKAQVFLLISKWEGFPRSILEAMRAGLPVIASDVGGARESVVDGETGFLVPRGDVYILRDRLATLINQAELRVQMGRKGRDRFLQNFTFQHMLTKTLGVYQEVLQAGPK
ncbi:MAG: glycosyltransferase family 4 protein [Bacillota bacterium]